MIDKTRFTVKQGDYLFAPKDAVTDVVLMDVAARYEQQVMRKITFIFPDQISQRFSGNNTVLETTKYDGEGVFIYVEPDKESFCFSASSGRARLGFPALDSLVKKLKPYVQKALFRAELYLPDRKNGVRENVSNVISASFQGNNEDISRFKLAVLDIIMLNGEDFQQKPFSEIWEKLDSLIGSDQKQLVHRADGSLVSEMKIEEIFNAKANNGEEGLVVRHLSRNEIFKIKPRRTIDAVVIGFVEGELENGHGITSLLTALSYPDPNKILLQTLVRIGSGFTDEQRASLLPVFESKKINTPLLMTDSDGRAVHFVRPEVIVEVLCEDLIETSASNKTNYTQVFSYEKSVGYTFEGISPSPRPSFATFYQLREDKTLESGGPRFSQISSVNSPSFRKTEKSEPELIRREVYVKGEMVRKLIMLKNASPDVPFPYLIYWTDYSAKRKDPLKTDFYIALDNTRADAIAQKLIEENIVKGWEKFVK